MTDTVKDQLIVVQSIKLMQLESSLALSEKEVRDTAKKLMEYKEILYDISNMLKFAGNYHNLIDVIKSRVTM